MCKPTVLFTSFMIFLFPGLAALLPIGHGKANIELP